jgi:hypothetical protein
LNIYSPCILIAVMSTFPITPSLPQATVIHEHELGWHDGVGDGVNSRWRRPGEQAQVTSGKHVVVHPTWQTISSLRLKCWVCFMCECTRFFVIKFLNEWANISEVMTCTNGSDCERSEENHKTPSEPHFKGRHLQGQKKISCRTNTSGYCFIIHIMHV